MKRLGLILYESIAACALFAAAILMLAAKGNAQNVGTFNHPGNILITDQFNNRVIEINHAGNIVWQFGGGPDNVGPTAIVGTNDAERVGGLTLMAGTGIPPGVAQASQQCFSSGCADNRVLLVNHAKKIVWQYGQFGVTGCGPNQLNVPVQNTYLSEPNGDDHILITDQSNERIIEVRRSDKAIVWAFGYDNFADNLTCTGTSQLNNPNAAELLGDGNILISDENNNRAIEVTHTDPSTIVATFTEAGGMLFSGVAFASHLPNGHTLITDSNNSRIVETDVTGADFWHFVTNTRPGSNPSPLPTRAVRLANGDTLISDQFNDQVIRVNMSGDIVASYGTINTPGFDLHNASVMNGPYSAYVIGDYTGLTSPF
jgi:hypothetical protein